MVNEDIEACGKTVVSIGFGSGRLVYEDETGIRDTFNPNYDSFNFPIIFPEREREGRMVSCNYSF